MSDTPEKRPESQADPMEPRADFDGTGGTSSQENAINEHERLAALDELDAARKQLLAAQEQMNAAQNRLSAIEKGMHVAPADNSHDKAAGVQTLAALPPDREEPLASAGQPQNAAGAAAAPVQEHFGVMNGLFDGFAKMGPIALFIFLACMAWPIFLPGANLNYCPGEIKSVTAFLHMLATGSWLAPVGLDNGAWTAAQWPVFSWCLALAGLVPGLAGSGLLFPVVSFCCVFAAVFAVWCLTIGTGFGARAAMASAIILLCAPIFAPMPHFVGPAALAAALMLFALLFFYRGWKAEHAWISLPLAFILTALAGLCGGILHFVTPLIASICFLIWRGQLRRGHRLDAIFGFILLLAIMGCWFGALMMGQNNAPYLEELFANAWQFAMPFPLKWLLPVMAGLLGLLPWLLIVFGVSWARVLAKSPASLSASRHDNGSAMLWISLVVAILLSIFIPWFHPAAIAIACLGAVLLGKAFIRMPHFGNCLFFLLAALLTMVAGALLLALTFPTTQTLVLGYLPALPIAGAETKLLSLAGLQVIGGLLVVGGLIGLFFVRRFRSAGGLFYAMLLVIVLCQPARLMLVPELSAMPGTPLVSYDAIEKQVINALLPPASDAAPAVAPAPVPADTAPAAPSHAAPAAEPGAEDQPVAPDVPASSAAPETSPAASGSASSEAGGIENNDEQPATGTPDAGTVQ